MNFRTLWMIILVVVIGLASVDARSLINLARRKFPGERRFGATHYRTHEFGSHGYRSYRKRD